MQTYIKYLFILSLKLEGIQDPISELSKLSLYFCYLVQQLQFQNKESCKMIKVTTLLLIVGFAASCLLAGRQIGICATNPLRMGSFCSSDIDAFICIPAHNKTWSEYNATYKDQQIQRTVLSIVQQQLIDEYINQNATLLLANNPSCYSSYKQFICKWNFPTCDNSNTSKPMCQSVCTSFHTNCGGSSDACSIIYNSIDLGLDESC